MEESEARAALGVTLQEVLRALSETQAQIEGVRVDVAHLVSRLDAHVSEHERHRRSWWRGIFSSMPSDRRPW